MTFNFIMTSDSAWETRFVESYIKTWTWSKKKVNSFLPHRAHCKPRGLCAPLNQCKSAGACIGNGRGVKFLNGRAIELPLRIGAGYSFARVRCSNDTAGKTVYN